VTPFHFEYLFRARDPDAVFSVYFDPEHQAAQDQRVDVARRETLEDVVWHKRDHRIEFDIRPRLLDGKAQILATYRLHQEAPGKVRRVYDGQVTVQVRLIGGRVEKTIAEDLEKSLIATAGCTQEYLDRRGLT
jgi:hypothetical protein